MTDSKDPVALDIFTREAVLAIVEKFRRQEAILRNLDEKINMLDKKINGMTVPGTGRTQPMDVLLIERLKNIEEKVNKLDSVYGRLRIPDVEREILEKLR